MPEASHPVESRLRISPGFARKLGDAAAAGDVEVAPLREPGRLSGDLVTGAKAAEASSTEASSAVSRHGRLRGNLLERAGVGRAMGYLRGLEDKRAGHSWRDTLSGETPLSEGGVPLDTKHCIRAAGVKVDGSVSFGGAIAGPDYKKLQRDDPAGRYKFYHSFSDRVRGEAYLTELVGRANELGLSMALKSFDHAYDGANVYTHDPTQMATLVEELYPKYKDAFLSTEHFLQGPLGGVDPEHIGWVQEPGSGIDSHSGRMGKLGSVLDAQGLGENAYRVGCQAAGVRPEAPWLLNDASLAELSSH